MLKKYTSIFFLISYILITNSAYADLKIAVLNYQLALSETDALKKYYKDIEEELKTKVNKINTLQKELKIFQQQLLTAEKQQINNIDLSTLELKVKDKTHDLEYLSKSLNEFKSIKDREILIKLKPKLDQAVNEIMQKGGYDLILDSNLIVNVKPKFDITKYVIERINKLT